MTNTANDGTTGPQTGVMVFAPAPDLTITLERLGQQEELHLHAGGQGVWIARMVSVLEVPVVLCGTFGGETGDVVRALLANEQLTIADVGVVGTNGAYVHDRRRGERDVVATFSPTPLTRHEVDDFYSVALAKGLGARVCVLAGTSEQWSPLPTDVYRRLARDLRASGVAVVTDLSGPLMHAALDGGVDVLKTSDEDLVDDGLLAEGAGVDDVVRVLHDLHEGGADRVIVSRGEEPSLVWSDGIVLCAHGPRVEAVDPKGAGDSLTAGLAATLAQGQDFDAALRVGLAAATLNVARRGLASGHREAILDMVARVAVAPLGPPDQADS